MSMVIKHVLHEYINIVSICNQISLWCIFMKFTQYIYHFYCIEFQIK
jgi:hypothetical protein